VKQKRNVRIKKEFVEFERVWFIIPFICEINKVYFILKKVCNICTYTKNNVYMILRKYLNQYKYTLTYICNFTTLFIILFRQQRKKLNIKKC